jgi:hypothetical protein
VVWLQDQRLLNLKAPSGKAGAFFCLIFAITGCGALVIMFFVFYASFCFTQDKSAQLIDTLSQDLKIIEPESPSQGAIWALPLTSYWWISARVI